MMKKTVAALSLLTALSAPALAAEEGFYVGLDLGQSSTDTFNLSTKTGTAISVLAGYQFMKYVAAEIQYNDFGSPTITNGPSFKIDGYSAAVLGILPLNEQWAIMAKLGYASTKLGSPINNTKSDFMYGVAGQYMIDAHWGARLLYDMYTVESPAPASQKATTSVLAVSAIYRF